MGKIKVIIFDFDGVIADSVNVKTLAFAELYESHGYKIKNKVVDHHNANGGMSRFEKFKLYQEEFLGLNVTDDEIQNLAERFSTLVVNKVINSPYVNGSSQFISKHSKTMRQYISSGTPQDEMRYIAKEKGIDTYFQAIYGSPKGKDLHVKEILHHEGVKSSEVVFVGDAESDRQAAHLNDLYFIGVENSHIDFSKELYSIKDLSELEDKLGVIERL
jgi:phosphoglycolate phosphatase-like HAD superfamily hydrolase